MAITPVASHSQTQSSVALGKAAGNTPVAAASMPTEAPASGPVDTVTLSVEAQFRMSGVTKLSVTAESLAQAAAAAKTLPGLDADAERFTPEAMAAHAEWRESHTDYKSKVRDLVDQTFGLSADRNGWAAGGAALTAIKNLAEKNGLIEPKMPPAVANMLQTVGESMWTDKSGGTTGMFDIAFLPNGAEKGGNLRILFDGGRKPSADTSLVDLKTGGTNARAALSNIRASALGAALDSVGGWTPGGAANAYAITNGTDGRGGVFGMVIANGVDEEARERSANILRTIQGLIP
ncbi:hypothetical protein FBZ82_101520 [Azospirillum brasilense]|uniref:Uncharacterized protein n=1 Tax=Azospirillum brasilense TaxID=192 RepID=A0A560BPG0_AZOBR|nr:hypothetical protein [Azospirillum brasilense]TWA74504.1 hypothetical protein FBZ82_101520 [Azospirillum brasilense]